MNERAEGSLKTYTIGFILSIVLTFLSYFAVIHPFANRSTLLVLLFGFGLLQVIVQLIFFLHLNEEKKPRWNLTLFLFMLLVLVIVVSGSIWIMNSLQNNLM